MADLRRITQQGSCGRRSYVTRWNVAAQFQLPSRLHAQNGLSILTARFASEPGNREQDDEKRSHERGARNEERSIDTGLTDR